MNWFRKYGLGISKFDIIVALAISILMLICLSFSVELKYAVIFSASCFFIYMILGWIISSVDNSKHRYFSTKGVLQGGFKQLLNPELLDGCFKINSFKERNSLFGTYREYDVDIVYDSESYYRKTNATGGYAFIVYHQPISLRKKLQLEDRYYQAWISFRPYRLIWNVSYVKMETTLSLINPSHKKIKRRMDTIINILEKEKMLPMKKGQKR